MAKDQPDYLDLLMASMMDAVNHGDPAAIREVVRLCREHGDEIELEIGPKQ